jgi:hypothetical protein
MLNRNSSIRYTFSLGPDIEADDLVRVDAARAEFARQFREITVALANGRKIDAIKLYRAATGQGLKESKDAVEAFAVQAKAVVPTLPGKSPDYRVVIEDNSHDCYDNRTVFFRLDIGTTKAEALAEAARRCENACQDEDVYLVEVIAKSKRTLSMVEA